MSISCSLCCSSRQMQPDLLDWLSPWVMHHVCAVFLQAPALPFCFAQRSSSAQDLPRCARCLPAPSACRAQRRRSPHPLPPHQRAWQGRACDADHSWVPGCLVVGLGTLGSWVPGCLVVGLGTLGSWGLGVLGSGPLALGLWGLGFRGLSGSLARVPFAARVTCATKHPFARPTRSFGSRP